MTDEIFYSKAHYPRVTNGSSAYRRLLMSSRLKGLAAAIEPKKGHKILDIGCDEGMAIKLLESAYSIKGYGIDISSEAIKKANHPRLRQAPAERLPYENETFDACISSHCIEHVPDPKKFLSEASRVLKSGGILALLYPWELWRGMTIIPDVLIAGKLPKPSLLTRIHRHKLDPDILLETARRLPLNHEKSKFFWSTPYIVPQYLSVFKKNV